jgi:alkanesulfonate monooxygenase SsuD/methylene tetrahydromethanopterin reductase-like flavin-dependent oxidoreductase (luciferase family)
LPKIKISAELSHICPLPEVIRHLEILEEKGFYRVWIPDTVVSPWEAWIVGSVVAQHTERIKIGLGVTNPYTRHPVVMAQMACTLQAFSQGRLALSLGKGIARFLEKAGIDQKEEALEECVTIMRHLIDGQRFSLEGKAFKLDGIKLRTDPPEKKVPFYLAAIGDPGWERASKIADGVSTFWNERIKEIRDRHLGRKPLPVSVLIPFSLNRANFFPNQVQSCDQLIERVNDLYRMDFDEVIIAYSDLNDLESITHSFSESGLM